MFLLTAAVALAELAVWPMPATFDAGTASATVSSKLHVEAPSIALIDQAVTRYSELCFPHKTKKGGQITTLRISVENNFGDAEGYTLKIANGTSTVELHAVAPVGVLRGLETWSQLIAFDFDNSVYRLQPVLPLSIEDHPRYAHRGLLIDSARHFLSVATLKSMIRSMSFAKLNVMHWHIIDDQSFPAPSRVDPDIQKMGAFSPTERYSVEDVQDLIAFGSDHGVSVVPEFDMPGHSKSWQNAHPEVFPPGCQDVALDPANPKSFELVQNLLTDWVGGTDPIYQTSRVHLGGDEVPTKCWRNQKDRAFLASHGFTKAEELYGFFMNKAIDMVEKMGKRAVVWDEAIGHVKSSAIVQVWHDASLATKAARNGHDVILSPVSGWYLDAPRTTWQQVYRVDPARIVPDDLQARVLGGEACMWGEKVDESDLFSTVWPRAAALAERLWGTAKEAEEAEPRMKRFRCLLEARGVEAGPVGIEARTAPRGPGSCSQSAWQDWTELTPDQRIHGSFARSDWGSDRADWPVHRPRFRMPRARAQPHTHGQIDKSNPFWKWAQSVDESEPSSAYFQPRRHESMPGGGLVDDSQRLMSELDSDLAADLGRKKESVQHMDVNTKLHWLLAGRHSPKRTGFTALASLPDPSPSYNLADSQESVADIAADLEAMKKGIDERKRR